MQENVDVMWYMGDLKRQQLLCNKEKTRGVLKLAISVNVTEINQIYTKTQLEWNFETYTFEYFNNCKITNNDCLFKCVLNILISMQNFTSCLRK